MTPLGGSVGRGGANVAGDTRLVQHLLNDSLGRLGQTLLAVDGIVGPKTIAAIEAYQRSNGLKTDGRVDPRGPTLKSLMDAHVRNLTAGTIAFGIPPTGQPKVDTSALAAALSDYWGVLKKA